MDYPTSPDAAARVLARIGGRSPGVIRRGLADSRLRAATAVAAAVLVGLLIVARDEPGPSSLSPHALLAETQLSAVFALDTAELDRRATADGLVSDLFDVELPE